MEIREERVKREREKGKEIEERERGRVGKEG